ncbi:sensor histidine kinase [Haloplanus sp. GCM10025708]|uniref:sensor histidine kinase n=1 Tax=Haloferacaceae TaxID=1644056 RepID=UPI003616AE67
MSLHSVRTAPPWVAPWVVVGVGCTLIGVALYNFAREIRILDTLWPPVVAVALSVGLAGGLVAAGLRLRESNLRPVALWRVAGWSLGGSAFLVLVSVLTIAIRLAEGRVVDEAVLDLLVSSAAGGLAGYLIGMNTVRADHEAADARQARDALAFLNRLLRHELLNGTNVIHGYAAQLDDAVPDAEADRLDAILARSEDLADLVRTMQPAARTFTADGSLDAVDLSSVLDRRIETIRRTYPHADVTADVPSEVYVRANDALAYIVHNLLANAVEHNDSDAPHVDVAVDVRGDTVRVDVADDGPGVADDRKEEIFRTKTHTERGFGLYLVRTLITRYGGEVWVEDNEPRGSVFVVELPRVATKPSSDP